MATLAQIEANRRNAQLSTGPRSVPGKESSRGNSGTHGLASKSILPEEIHPEYAGRLAEWAGHYPAETPEQRFALEMAVAMTFRIGECGEAYRTAVASTRDRARYAWDVDRKAEAADLLAQLPRRPEVIVPKLEASAHGVMLLLGLWGRLRESLDAWKVALNDSRRGAWNGVRMGAWNDAEVATACDLMAIPTALRNGPKPFDPQDPSANLYEFRRAWVDREIDRLEGLRERQLRRADRRERARAVAGTSASQTRPVRLALRYEREAIRRYDAAMGVVKAAARAEGPAAIEAGELVDETAEEPPVVQLGRIVEETPGDPINLDEPGLDRALTEIHDGGLAGLLERPGMDARAGGPGPVAPPRADGPATPHRPMNRHARRREAALARQSA